MPIFLNGSQALHTVCILLYTISSVAQRGSDNKEKKNHLSSTFIIVTIIFTNSCDEKPFCPMVRYEERVLEE